MLRTRKSLKTNQRGLIQKLHFESWPETCIPSMESFEPMVTTLCSGQEMLYKINRSGIIKNTEQGRVMFLVHCTLRHCQKHAY